MPNGFIVLRVFIPATLYPTLTVREGEWEQALRGLEGGKQLEVSGVTGGAGCRGETLGQNTATLKLVRADDSLSRPAYLAEIVSGDIVQMDPGEQVLLYSI